MYYAHKYIDTKHHTYTHNAFHTHIYAESLLHIIFFSFLKNQEKKYEFLNILSVVHTPGIHSIVFFYFKFLSLRFFLACDFFSLIKCSSLSFVAVLNTDSLYAYLLLYTKLLCRIRLDPIFSSNPLNCLCVYHKRIF